MTSSQDPTPFNSPQHAPSTQDEKNESIEENLRTPFKSLDVQSVTLAYDTEFARLSQYEAGMFSITETPSRTRERFDDGQPCIYASVSPIS